MRLNSQLGIRVTRICGYTLYLPNRARAHPREAVRLRWPRVVRNPEEHPDRVRLLRVLDDHVEISRWRTVLVEPEHACMHACERDAW